MGQPKKQRRKYSRPVSLWKGNRIVEDQDLVRKYGMSNNKELWKIKSEVARIRSLARNLLAKPDERTTGQLLAKLRNMGLLDKEAKLEDVLTITIEDLLERRLQTQVYRKGMSNSISQARQFIVHGHIVVSGERMNVPGHLLTTDEEKDLAFYRTSSLSDPDHPVRKIKKTVPEPKSEAKHEEKAGGGEAGKPNMPKISKASEVKEEQPELTKEEIVAEASGDIEEPEAEPEEEAPSEAAPTEEKPKEAEKPAEEKVEKSG